MDKNFFYEYIYGAKPFVQHTPSHWGALIVSALLIIFVPYLSKRFLSKENQIVVGKIIGWIIFGSYFAWIFIEIAAGTFELKKHLPFQLCRFSNIVVILMLNYRREFWFQIIYYWTVTAVLQASFAPDMQQDFPHFYFFRFFIGHTGMILAVVYALVVYEMKPTLQGYKNGFIATNIYALFTILLNLSLGSNYFYTLAKPQTASPLDHFGPWPWYILVCEVILLVQGGLFYIHIWLPKLLRMKKIP